MKAVFLVKLLLRGAGGLLGLAVAALVETLARDAQVATGSLDTQLVGGLAAGNGRRKAFFGKRMPWVLPYHLQHCGQQQVQPGAVLQLLLVLAFWVAQLGFELLDTLFRGLRHGWGCAGGSAPGRLQGSQVGGILAAADQHRAVVA